MNWKNRLKNYNFWISIFSAMLLILQALKIKFDVAYVNEIFTAVLGLLVVIGIISDPTKTTVKSQEVNVFKQTSEQKLPTIVENEANNGNIQDDFQTIVAALKSELDKTKEDLSIIKKTVNNSIVGNIEKMSREGVNFEPSPVAAEKSTIADNPYVDVIN